MPKRKEISPATLTYEVIKDTDFCKSRIDVLDRGLRKGMPFETACDLAQLPREKVTRWMENYVSFELMVKSSRASFLEKMFDSLNEKSEKNASTAIRYFSEIRKMEKDTRSATEKEVSDDLFDILTELEK